MFSLLASLALAATPEVVVVGVHVDKLSVAEASAASARLAEALEGTGKADALAGEDVSRRIAGREPLILDAYGMGAGQERLTEGRVLYDRAQPDQAIPVLADAVRQLTAGLAVSTDVRPLHDAFMTLGLAQAGMGEEAAAKATFRRSVVLDPDRQLDTVRYSPDVVELYEAVRTEVRGLKPGKLDVAAVGEAHVWIDGRDAGPAPVTGAVVAPGDHYVLVRSATGETRFDTVTVTAGESRSLKGEYSSPGLGTAAADPGARARQARDLYRAVGGYVDDAVVLLAGETTDGQVAVQLYAARSGTFSRPVTGEAGGDPVGAIADLVPTVVGYLGDNGDIRADRVSPNAVALDVGDNAHLASLLLNPPDLGTVIERRGVPWVVWAGLGVAVAGGGAAAAAVVLTSTGGEEPPPNQNGTIQFGPIP